jgi:Fe-S-cluster formation regulator IscX/YfhJ
MGGWSQHHHAWGWRVAEGLEVSGPSIDPVVVPFNDLHDMVLVLARAMLSNDRSYQRWALSALAARRPRPAPCKRDRCHATMDT